MAQHAQGDVDLWLESELLSGTCAVLGSPVGANGIVFHHGALSIANTGLPLP